MVNLVQSFLNHLRYCFLLLEWGGLRGSGELEDLAGIQMRRRSRLF